MASTSTASSLRVGVGASSGVGRRAAAPARVASALRASTPATARHLAAAAVCAGRSSPARASVARRTARPRLAVVANAGGGGGDDEKPAFGYTRKDVLLIGAGIFAAGYGAYYGLQANGMDAGRAGNYVQLTVFVFLTFGWVGSYLWRVGTKNMTYVRQLEAYEEAVMAKRLEEMPEAERTRLVEEAEAERAARSSGKGGGGGGAA